jgi:enamine deaminase RidA (YjgF/YER057c/UK114 family)
MAGMNDAEVLQRLSDAGIELPAPPAPVAAYLPVRVSGDTAYVAGQVGLVDGKVLNPGRLGDPRLHLTVEQGQESARRAALQALAALRDALGGSFERLVSILQVTVYVAASPDFVEHPTVANGASELLEQVLGEPGRHARAAIGVASLPLGGCVEVAVTARVEPV